MPAGAASSPATATVAAASVRDDGSSSSGSEPPTALTSLTFSRWFARRAYASDLLFLLLELLAAAARTRQTSLSPAARRADALLAAFPCGASSAGRFLYVLRAAAAFDPLIGLRFMGWGNVAHTFGQLLALAVALATPTLYERIRHGLFVGITAATLLGLWASAAWTPDALLPLVASGLAARRGLSAIYFGCKAATVLRIPSSLQLYVGPATWLLLLAAEPAAPRQLQQPPQQPGSRPAADECVSAGWPSARPVAPTAQLQAAAAAVTQGSPADLPSAPDIDHAVSSTIVSARVRQRVLRSPSLLYGSGRGTIVLSVKVPLPQVEDSTARQRQHREAAAAVMAAAGAALRPYLDRGSDGESSGGAAGGLRRRRLHPMSAVCVEGCVHLLITLRWGVGGGDGGREDGVHHAALQQAGAEVAGGVDGAAVSAALHRMLAGALSYNTPGRTQQQQDSAVLWPPAIALAAAGQDGGAGGAGGSMRTPPPQLSKGGAEVLVLLPAALLRGQGAVRCVVGWPSRRKAD
ncbi:hypothetical protein TSOC_003221 [Tetrabaena socialis]|uniref:Uncharacterized protein n=1 Tax=Tetrabaena socialis TaxID=47790 RepID=A0A2J8AC86_9CHLO|nr:hypothetical protein TSOC_003221 [Tetrabaena socialis]|eukprot:PNH10103.1 hypothetical protein TSOC_003221 [Tetrabaena socialis]